MNIYSVIMGISAVKIGYILYYIRVYLCNLIICHSEKKKCLFQTYLKHSFFYFQTEKGKKKTLLLNN